MCMRANLKLAEEKKLGLTFFRLKRFLLKLTKNASQSTLTSCLDIHFTGYFCQRFLRVLWHCFHYQKLYVRMHRNTVQRPSNYLWVYVSKVQKLSPITFKQFLDTNLEKQLLHLFHNLTPLLSISRTTGDLCYMVPALFEHSPHYLAVLAYGILLFF